MNEVSIIINGVRYDAVDIPDKEKGDCEGCDITDLCYGCDLTLGDFCVLTDGDNRHFKKSAKSFEP